MMGPWAAEEMGGGLNERCVEQVNTLARLLWHNVFRALEGGLDYAQTDHPGPLNEAESS